MTDAPNEIQTLQCDSCGYESLIEAVADIESGEPMSVDFYTGLVHAVGWKLLCGFCSGDPEPQVKIIET